MNISKKDIKKNIVNKSLVSNNDGSKILESFLSLVKIESQLKIVKLSGFGSFSFKKSPERIGRNPKTKESYIIPISNKLHFKASNKVKGKMN